MKAFLRSAIVMAACTLVGTAHAQSAGPADIPTAQPESVGVDSRKLVVTPQGRSAFVRMFDLDPGFFSTVDGRAAA